MLRVAEHQIPLLLLLLYLLTLIKKIIVKCINYGHKVWLSKHQYLILSFPLPNISFASVALPVNHFGAHPVGGASDRLDARAGHADGLDAFAGAEVAQLYVP